MGMTLRSVVTSYAIAFLMVVLALVLALSVAPLKEAAFTLFLAAIMVSAWYGGVGPGLFATALATGAVDFFFLPPLFTFGPRPEDRLPLAIFLAVAVLTGLLNGIRQRLEETLRQQSRHREQFLSVLAHELRTPLSTTQNVLMTVRRTNVANGPVQELCQIGERQVQTMSRLIDDLLDVSRVRLGKLRLCKERICLNTLVVLAVDSAQPLIDSRKHRLEVTVPPEHIWLDADPTRLQQVLVNLLVNAARYTDPGGTIDLMVEESDGKVLLHVKDSGIGMTPDSLTRVFDLFAQTDDGAHGGLGIGLSLVRDLVNLHGGTVSAWSAGPGAGSEFIVTLPLPAKVLQLSHNSH
jgi:signal transduction histidine kinase